MYREVGPKYNLRGIVGWCIPVALCVSCGLNIAGLLNVFLIVKVFKSEDVILTPPYGIWLLWTEEMKFLAILVTLFSIIFPFVKLISMSVFWALPRHTFCLRRYMRTLSFAGRFSLIDVFVVLIVLVMAHD